MAPPRIIFSPKALSDLEGIESYIAERDGEARAAAVRARFEKSVENLSFMPGIGNRRPYLPQRMRAFSTAPWIIYYMLLPAGDGIRVDRIVDGRRDLPAMFQELE